MGFDGSVPSVGKRGHYRLVKDVAFFRDQWSNEFNIGVHDQRMGKPKVCNYAWTSEQIEAWFAGWDYGSKTEYRTGKKK